ncbi:hypothetical protein ABIB25_005862 [Nakamurella sp. UYEF19]|uniref:hypothetical protein n=1 Tax=Nakamurella sp. UYEF19 TaxID=1756392 RepID=UPI003391B5B8
MTATSGGTVPIYPVQQIQPCTGARYGEITAVISTLRPTMVKSAGDNRYLDDPNLDSCIPTVTQYVGAATQPILRFWHPYLLVNAVMASPTPRQKAAGQHWAACIVALFPSDFTATVQTPGPPQYDKSIRNALHTGEQRDRLGTCLPTTDWNDTYNNLAVGGCRQPHAREILGYGDSGDQPVPRTQVEASCQQLARQLTAMADPTADGALSAQINVRDNRSAVITTAQIPAHSNLACAITTTGTGKLDGSLLARGRQPIPWA